MTGKITPHSFRKSPLAAVSLNPTLASESSSLDSPLSSASAELGETLS